DKSFLTASSVCYDAVYVPSGINSVATLEADPDAIHFLNEAFKHCKAIAADTDAKQVLQSTYFVKKLPPDNSDESVLKEGIVINDNAATLADQFINAISQHRFWDREKARKVPA
ncbi:MAG: catalase HPII, partial [Ferruginibacter sp.]